MQIRTHSMPVTADKTGKSPHRPPVPGRGSPRTNVDLAVLPEMFVCPYEKCLLPHLRGTGGGPAQETLRKAAADLGLYVVVGLSSGTGDDRVYNTTTCLRPDVTQLAKHRKVHLF